ncbi:hypothetical protein MTO96_030626, partial [Rhipicephalus appendiculatus]
VFESFPAAAVAISDVKNDGDFDCLTMVMYDYEPSVPTATFSGLLKGLNGREPDSISAVELTFGTTLRVPAAFFTPALTGKGKHQLKHEVTDAKAVFDNFASAVAVFDVDKDGDLDCLSTVRLDYDKNASTATYFWILKNMNGHESHNISFLVGPGPAPNQFLVKDKDSDEPVQIGTYDYSDYKNCIIMEMPYHGSDECVLWVSENVIDDIPQHCLDHYEDNCEDAKLAYDKGSCTMMDN